MKGVVLFVLVIVIGVKTVHSQNIYDDERTERYDYVYDECINEDFVPPDCFVKRLERWEEHLDSVSKVLKNKLIENNYLEEHKLFEKNQNVWSEYFKSQNNYDQEFLWNTWLGVGGHRNMKDRVYVILIERCLFIEDDIERLEFAIEWKEEEDDD